MGRVRTCTLCCGVVVTVSVALLLVEYSPAADQEFIKREKPKLGSVDSGERYYAASVLGMLGVPEALPVLCEVFEKGSEAQQYFALTKLGRCSDAEYIWNALKGVDASKVGVRSAVPMVLIVSRVRGDRADGAQWLLRAVRNPVRDVGRVAAEKLGERGDVSILPEIRRCVRDGSVTPDTRIALLVALRDISLRRIEDDLRAEGRASGDQSVNQRAGELADGLPLARVRAVRPVAGDATKIALSEEERRRCRSVIESSVSVKEKMDALQVLMFAKDKESVELLMRVADTAEDTGLRGDALLALGVIGDRRALPVAEKLERSSDRGIAEVAKAVVNALRNGTALSLDLAAEPH